MIPYLSEFIGTAMLVILGDGVCVSNTFDGCLFKGSGPIYIMLGWGLAVMLPAMAFGVQSGAHFNPALTISLAVIGAFEWGMVPGYIICQMLGGFVGACILWLIFKDQFDQATDPGAIKGVFCTGPAIRNIPMNILGEAAATFFLVFFIVTIPADAASGLGKFFVNGIIMSCGFSLGSTTGFAMNWARDISPRLAHQVLPIPNKGDSDWGYAIVPIVGPLIGGILGALLGNIVVGWL